MTTTTTTALDEHLARIREASEPLGMVARDLRRSWVNVNDRIVTTAESIKTDMDRLVANVRGGFHANFGSGTNDLAVLVARRQEVIENVKRFEFLLSEAFPSVAGFDAVLLVGFDGDR